MPVRLIALLLPLALLISGVSVMADDIATDNPVLMTYAIPDLAPELFRKGNDNVRTASFCGACTAHDDCGSGWRCCTHGCTDDKLKCYEVASCDKLAEGTGPLKLFTSR